MLTRGEALRRFSCPCFATQICTLITASLYDFNYSVPIVAIHIKVDELIFLDEVCVRSIRKHSTHCLFLYQYVSLSGLVFEASISL